jgi:hypothetical protein
MTDVKIDDIPIRCKKITILSEVFLSVILLVNKKMVRDVTK